MIQSWSAFFVALQELIVDFPQRHFLSPDVADVLRPLVERFGEPRENFNQRVESMLGAATAAATRGEKPGWEKLLLTKDSATARLGFTGYRSKKVTSIHLLAGLLVTAVKSADIAAAVAVLNNSTKTVSDDQDYAGPDSHEGPEGDNEPSTGDTEPLSQSEVLTAGVIKDSDTRDRAEQEGDTRQRWLALRWRTRGTRRSALGRAWVYGVASVILAVRRGGAGVLVQ